MTILRKSRGLENFVAAAAVLSLAFLASGCGEIFDSAPTDPVARIIDVRQDHFKDIGRNFKRIDDEINASEPDFEIIAESAKRIQTISADLLTWFPAGSGPESGFETDAMPAIWVQPEKFEAVYRDEYLVEIDRLAQVVEQKDVQAIATQYYAAGAACSNCHKPFRVKRD